MSVIASSPSIGSMIAHSPLILPRGKQDTGLSVFGTLGQTSENIKRLRARMRNVKLLGCAET